MIKYIFLFLCAILLVGCAQNRALNYFDKEVAYAKAIQYTNKCDIVYKDELRVMLTGTYLNSVNSKWNDENENFIVGIYIVQSNEEQEVFYQNNKFELLLDKFPYALLKPLSKEHEMINNLPLYNPWADYFVVKFNPSKISLLPIKADLSNITSEQGQKKIEIPSYALNLKLNHTTLGSCALSFPEE